MCTSVGSFTNKSPVNESDGDNQRERAGVDTDHSKARVVRMV